MKVNQTDNKSKRVGGWAIINLIGKIKTIKQNTMKKNVIIKISQLKVNDSTQGETIEKKFQRILENKEPITDGAPLIYTERKDGVQAGYNIRTDRWDVALDVMNVVHRSRAAKRENTPEPEQNKATGTDGTAEPIQGTTE